MKAIGAGLPDNDESAESEDSVTNDTGQGRPSPRPASRLSPRDSDELSDNNVAYFLVCPDSDDDTRIGNDMEAVARLSIEL